MVNRILSLLIVCLFVAIVLPGGLNAAASGKLQKMDEISREMAKVRNQEIVFFGKVVDLAGNPVNGAKVHMSVRVFGARLPQTPFHELYGTSDEEGLFNVSGCGDLISLENISREGYVYHFKYNRERSRGTSKAEQAKGLGFASDKPMVFRVHKKEPPSFVLTGSMDFALAPGKSKLLDLYRREWVSPRDERGHRMMRPDWKADMKVSVEEDPEGFRVTFEVLDPDSGFVVENREFFEEMREAPEHGYRPKIVLPLKRDSAGQLFAYVKNSGGLFYSKLSANYSNNHEWDFVGLRFGYITNMEGARDLEYEDEKYGQYLDDVRTGRRKDATRKQLLTGGVVAPFREESQ